MALWPETVHDRHLNIHQNDMEKVGLISPGPRTILGGLQFTVQRFKYRTGYSR